MCTVYITFRSIGAFLLGIGRVFPNRSTLRLSRLSQETSTELKDLFFELVVMHLSKRIRRRTTVSLVYMYICTLYIYICIYIVV